MCCMAHPRVVNSAYFAPCSGAKLLSTCVDNRLRVWDCWLGQREQPSREMVHSHDFNRRGACAGLLGCLCAAMWVLTWGEGFSLQASSKHAGKQEGTVVQAAELVLVSRG